jgi:hypothetical protein
MEEAKDHTETFGFSSVKPSGTSTKFKVTGNELRKYPFSYQSEAHNKKYLPHMTRESDILRAVWEMYNDWQIAREISNYPARSKNGKIYK